jgi:hypothetical protein
MIETLNLKLRPNHLQCLTWGLLGIGIRLR